MLCGSISDIMEFIRKRRYGFYMEFIRKRRYGIYMETKIWNLYGNEDMEFEVKLKINCAFKI